MLEAFQGILDHAASEGPILVKLGIHPSVWEEIKKHGAESTKGWLHIEVMTSRWIPENIFVQFFSDDSVRFTRFR